LNLNKISFGWKKRILQEIEATPPGVLSSRDIEPSVNGDNANSESITRKSPLFRRPTSFDTDNGKKGNESEHV
jgi:hypothetical protein